METTRLIYFLAAAETENITKAAQKLHISQPALSKAIKTLETELRAELFTRKGNRIVLNDYGIAYRGYAERMLQETEGIKRRMEDIRTRRKETVSIGFAYPVDEPLWLYECVRDFILRHPDVNVRLVQLDTATVSESLRNGKVNIAVSMSPPKTAGTEVIDLQPEPMGIMVASDHPLAHKEQVYLRDLAGVRFLCPDVGTDTSWLLRKCCALAGVSPDIVFEGPHTFLIDEFVWKGLGVTFMSYGVFRRNVQTYHDTYSNPKLSFRKIQDDFCVRPCSIAIIKDYAMSDVTREFYESMKKYAHLYKDFSDL